jgi:hypothetical protein
MAKCVSPALYTEGEDGYGGSDNENYKFKEVKKNINEITEDYDSCKNDQQNLGN